MYIYLAFALGAFFIMFEYQRVNFFWGYHPAFLKRLLIALSFGIMGPIGFLAALYKVKSKKIPHHKIKNFNVPVYTIKIKMI